MSKLYIKVKPGFAIVKLFGNTLCKLRLPLIKLNACKTFMLFNFKGYLKVRPIIQQNKNELICLVYFVSKIGYSFAILTLRRNVMVG